MRRRGKGGTLRAGGGPFCPPGKAVEPMNKIPSKARSGRSWLVPLLAALALAVVLALPGLACPRTSCPGCGGTRCAQTPQFRLV